MGSIFSSDNKDFINDHKIKNNNINDDDIFYYLGYENVIVNPFYCSCCGYIWETLDRFRDHFFTENRKETINRLIKLYNPILLKFPYTEKDVKNINRCVAKKKVKSLNGKEKIILCLRKVIEGKLMCQGHINL